MVDFSNLKKSSGNLDKLSKAIEQLNAPQGGRDADSDNFWRPETDKVGNGYAVIRFLPAPAVDGDDGLPWVKMYNHGFQGPGGWYIENSLTTLNQADPVGEYNTQLWNSGLEANKEIARKQKRRLNYISNVLVLEDPKHPENEGKVFLFRFGKKIFDKLTEAMNPQFADEKPVNPFDMWAGANFKLKIRKVEGYANYDKSEFESASAIYDDDDKLEALWKKELSLKEHVSPEKFKSYDELKGKMNKVLGLDGYVAQARSTAESATVSAPRGQGQMPEPAVEVVKPKASISDVPWDTEDDMSYFNSLASED